MSATTEDAVMAEIKEMRQAFEKIASRPATSPEAVFSGRNPSGFQGDVRPWNDAKLAEQLKRLEPYDRTAVDMLANQRSGRVRLSGCGGALVKMAALAGNADARAVARVAGMTDGYGEEQFEKEYQFVSVAKAAKTGLPWSKGVNGEVRKAALAEGSGSTGGYVIPPQFQNELLTIAAEEGFIEQRAKVIPMNTRTVQWPMLDITTAQSTGTSPYFGGILAQWQPEAASISETEPAFKQSEWVAWDLVLYTVSSNQLLADNGIGLDALLTQLFGQAATWYKEYAYLRGTGSGSTMPLGVLNAPATYVQNRAVSSRFLLADAAAMMAHLQIRSWDDACWIMHQSVLPQLLLMVDGGSATGATGTGASTSYPGGNRLVWMNPTMSGNLGPAAQKMPNAFLNGLPVFFTEKMPTLGTKGDVMLVDWSRYVIGMRLDLQIDVSPHYLFRNNQLAWRVICRADGRPWMNGPVVDANGWTVSPFVALN